MKSKNTVTKIQSSFLMLLVLASSMLMSVPSSGSERASDSAAVSAHCIANQIESKLTGPKHEDLIRPAGANPKYQFELRHERILGKNIEYYFLDRHSEGAGLNRGVYLNELFPDQKNDVYLVIEDTHSYLVYHPFRLDSVEWASLAGKNKRMRVVEPAYFQPGLIFRLKNIPQEKIDALTAKIRQNKKQYVSEVDGFSGGFSCVHGACQVIANDFNIHTAGKLIPDLFLSDTALRAARFGFVDEHGKKPEVEMILYGDQEYYSSLTKLMNDATYTDMHDSLRAGGQLVPAVGVVGGAAYGGYRLHGRY